MMMKTGKLNAITDVKGVLVGHTTLVDGDVQTGVTAILPKPFDWFNQKTRAAVHVINGFGKSIGLTQIEELYTLETPILLTNTLSAAHAADCLIKFMMSHNSEIGGKVGTVNPVVCECNDGYLNNIRRQLITEHDVFNALNNASSEFDRGAVGAGRGMSCYQLKGGIGTASRLIELADETYTLGCLVLTNMGELNDMRIKGIDTEEIKRLTILSSEPDKGSVIIILAMDLPLESHQLKRVIKRATAGLSRTGTIIGHGSGDIVIGFSTAESVNLIPTQSIETRKSIHDVFMDEVFRGTVEVVEAAIIDSLMSADEVVGFNGHNRKALKNLTKRP